MFFYRKKSSFLKTLDFSVVALLSQKQKRAFCSTSSGEQKCAKILAHNFFVNGGFNTKKLIKITFFFYVQSINLNWPNIEYQK
ncbi:MAG: hypothetical protein D4R94_00445 [Chitinophagaceae bacterium]|nr:MAG: hypothetical protein D4R94_00445 [Chitinophagaceae bacterium]